MNQLSDFHLLSIAAQNSRTQVCLMSYKMSGNCFLVPEFVGLPCNFAPEAPTEAFTWPVLAMPQEGSVRRKPSPLQLCVFPPSLLV